MGKAVGNIIWLEENSAGWGSYVDATPRDDSEFTTPGDQGRQGRMDLRTVLAHEVGHVLGRGHEATGVMQETLPAGTRRTASPALAANSDWFGAGLTGLESDDGTPWIGGHKTRKH
jgi:hypothetical protein